MAKRFTDTDIWKKPWFRKLSPKLKCAWKFIVDNCDHAGLFELDAELMSFQIGEEIDKDEIVKVFGERLNEYKPGKFFIQGFVDFQYGELKETNNAHKSVIAKLAKSGACEPLKIPSRGDQDKDKDKDKDKEKDKEKDNSLVNKQIKKQATTPRLPVQNLEQLSRIVSTEKLEKWAKEYGDDEWLKNELIHAIEWSEVNKPERTSAGWTLFFTGWLKRSKPPREQKKTFAQIEQENSNAAMKRVSERLNKKYADQD